MGRTVADVAALLQAIAGEDAGDPRQRDVSAADYVAAVATAPDSLADVRLGVVAEGFAEAVGAEPATVEAVRATVERLRGLGAETVDVSLPEHLQAGGIAFIGFVEGMTNLMETGGNGYSWPGRYWQDLAPALQAGLREHAQELSPQMKIALITGRWLRSRYAGALYAKAQNLRPWLVRRVRPRARERRRAAAADDAVAGSRAGAGSAARRPRAARLGEPGEHLPDRHDRPPRALAAAGRGRRAAGRGDARRAPFRRRAPAFARGDLRARARLGAGT